MEPSQRTSTKVIPPLLQRYLAMWKQFYNWVADRGWKTLESSEDRKVTESLEILRDCYLVVTEMLIVILTVKFRLMRSQMEMRNLLGTGAKIILVVP